MSSVQGIQSTSMTTDYQLPKKQVKSVEHEDSKQEEICVASTDRVDGEIAMLKAKEAQLTSKLGTMDKESAQYGILEQELSKVEKEISLKNNDTYRRQNTDFSSGVDIEA